MDWPTATVSVVAIAALLIAYLRTIAVPPDVSTEAIGFHVGSIEGATDDEDR